jgi:hypothetical protein
MRWLVLVVIACFTLDAHGGVFKPRNGPRVARAAKQRAAAPAVTAKAKTVAPGKTKPKAKPKAKPAKPADDDDDIIVSEDDDE